MELALHKQVRKLVRKQAGKLADMQERKQVRKLADIQARILEDMLVCMLVGILEDNMQAELQVRMLVLHSIHRWTRIGESSPCSTWRLHPKSSS